MWAYHLAHYLIWNKVWSAYFPKALLPPVPILPWPSTNATQILSRFSQAVKQARKHKPDRGCTIFLDIGFERFRCDKHCRRKGKKKRKKVPLYTRFATFFDAKFATSSCTKFATSYTYKICCSLCWSLPTQIPRIISGYLVPIDDRFILDLFLPRLLELDWLSSEPSGVASECGCPWCQCKCGCSC